MTEVFDITGLPQELIGQLTKRAASNPTQEDVLLAILQHETEPRSIDWLLVQIYRTEGQVWKRGSLNAALYRLTKGDIIRRVTVGMYVYNRGDA
ncbi:hypothetical protein [Cupriavidus campinensis]|uniref:Helix-turn-helix domain-containing protein n=1 Tax=Cupriavidus campinensis TaxID=151783 RepID=A0ABY3ELC8_9BURK|nr:hypothetical protein [Cupriavidus campinensis]TSP11453.1 hypothetical protein FGG12_17610 [Cupriavidus campinensis]